jgi:hypothetical protein
LRVISPAPSAKPFLLRSSDPYTTISAGGGSNDTMRVWGYEGVVGHPVDWSQEQGAAVISIHHGISLLEDASVRYLPDVLDQPSIIWPGLGAQLQQISIDKWEHIISTGFPAAGNVVLFAGQHDQILRCEQPSSSLSFTCAAEFLPDTTEVISLMESNASDADFWVLVRTPNDSIAILARREDVGSEFWTASDALGCGATVDPCPSPHIARLRSWPGQSDLYGFGPNATVVSKSVQSPWISVGPPPGVSELQVEDFTFRDGLLQSNQLFTVGIERRCSVNTNSEPCPAHLIRWWLWPAEVTEIGVQWLQPLLITEYGCGSALDRPCLDEALEGPVAIDLFNETMRIIGNISSHDGEHRALYLFRN